MTWENERIQMDKRNKKINQEGNEDGKNKLDLQDFSLESKRI